VKILGGEAAAIDFIQLLC